MDPTLGLAAKYGINRSEFWVKPGLTLRLLAFNSSRPLFRNNPRLRRAINLALDRKALQATAGGRARATGHRPVPPSQRARIHGSRGSIHSPAPTSRRVRALARGRRLRGGKAVLYTTEFALALQAAQLVKHSSSPRSGSTSNEGPRRSTSRRPRILRSSPAGREAWDIALVLWTPNIPDPHAYLNELLEAGEFLDGTTLTRFRSSPASPRARRAARTLQVRERNGAYGMLDALLAQRVRAARRARTWSTR